MRYLAHSTNDLKDEQVLGFLAVSWLKDEPVLWLLIPSCCWVGCCGWTDGVVEWNSPIYTAHHVPLLSKCQETSTPVEGASTKPCLISRVCKISLFSFDGIRNRKKMECPHLYTLDIHALLPGTKVHLLQKGKIYKTRKLYSFTIKIIWIFVAIYVHGINREGRR